MLRYDYRCMEDSAASGCRPFRSPCYPYELRYLPAGTQTMMALLASFFAALPPRRSGVLCTDREAAAHQFEINMASFPGVRKVSL